jgi:SHS2 domain-containing protein
MSERPAIEFLDDVTSDLAFVARGGSLEAAFAAAAEAVLEATVENPEDVVDRVEARIELEEPDVELLLLAFLNELVFLRDARGWLLRARDLQIAVEPGRATLEARVAGEPMDFGRHRPAAEVKAATAHGLRVRSNANQWEVAVTLDV